MAKRAQRAKRGARADSPPAPAGETNRLSHGVRLALWVGIGLLPPLAASAVLLVFASGDPEAAMGGVGATVLNFALVIMGLTTFNVLVQARGRWSAPEADNGTYVSGLFSSAGVAVGGLVAFLLTGSLLTALVLMVVSLGAALAVRPRS